MTDRVTLQGGINWSPDYRSESARMPAEFQTIIYPGQVRKVAKHDSPEDALQSRINRALKLLEELRDLAATSSLDPVIAILEGKSD